MDKKTVFCIIVLKDGREVCSRFEKVGTVNGCESVTVEFEGLSFTTFGFASVHGCGCNYNAEINKTVLSIPTEIIDNMYLKHGRQDRRRHNNR